MAESSTQSMNSSHVRVLPPRTFLPMRSALPSMRRPLAVNVAGGFTSGRKRTRFALAFSRRRLRRGAASNEASSWARSKEGEESTFTVYSPQAVIGEALSSAPGETAVETRHGNKTILLVDDQEDLRRSDGSGSDSRGLPGRGSRPQALLSACFLRHRYGGLFGHET